jgi:AAA domain
MSYEDPYPNNCLNAALGPYLSQEQILRTHLERLPRIPAEITEIPRYVRMHFLMRLSDAHFPSSQDIETFTTIDLALRSSYGRRNPCEARTWAVIGKERPRLDGGHPAKLIAVVGIPGTGKSQLIYAARSLYPSQVITHESFPNITGPFAQLAHLSINIPASGKLSDLARTLMLASDRAMGTERFAEVLGRTRPDASALFDEWLQFAESRFLGILHLDEVQNFFKFETLKKRSKKSNDDRPKLRIADDTALKRILTLSNTSDFVLVLSGSPDGMAALQTRLSTAGRFVVGGWHELHVFADSNDQRFRGTFLKPMLRFQYVRDKLVDSDDLAITIIELTGGVPRFIIALWIAAHRVAFARHASSDLQVDDLRIDDLKIAARLYFTPIEPAIRALRSRDPALMRQYEDLLPDDTMFWSGFWSQMSTGEAPKPPAA